MQVMSITIWNERCSSKSFNSVAFNWNTRFNHFKLPQPIKCHNSLPRTVPELRRNKNQISFVQVIPQQHIGKTNRYFRKVQ